MGRISIGCKGTKGASVIEARAFVTDLAFAQTILGVERAVFKGAYRIHDTIFRNKVTRAPLAEEFLRLRYIPSNIWQERPVILALKKTVPQGIGKISDVPVKREFDTVEDARHYYDQNFSAAYDEDFSFWRDGWQYVLPSGDVVDLELIEGRYPSIEFKSETDAGIHHLLATFGVTADQIIRGPSVVAVRELLI